MSPQKLSTLARALDARLVGDDQIVTSVSTSSQDISAGALFIALRGEKFDGHDFLNQVAQAGAVAAVVCNLPPQRGGTEGGVQDFLADSTIEKSLTQPLPSRERGQTLSLLVVADTRKALGQLGQFIRRQFTKTRVIAVAGSNGKTSTKNLIHDVLKTALKGTVSPKSFNNDIGVPLTMFPVAPDDDYVVAEVGTNHPGEVEHLSRMIEPDIALITSIGAEHLEFFKDLNGVRKENATITTGLRPNGLLIMTGDDQELPSHLPPPRGGTEGGASQGKSDRRITFGFFPDSDMVAHEVEVTLDGTSFHYQGKKFHVPLLGTHAASNALAAIAVAREMGLSDEQIVAGLAQAGASDMRMQKKIVGDITVLVDCYNANPTSVTAAIHTMRQVAWPGRKILFLGDMKELGDTATPEHHGIGRLIGKCDFDAIHLTGEASRHTLAGAKMVNDQTAIHWHSTIEEILQNLPQYVRSGDLVLVKASRSMKFERIVEGLQKVNHQDTKAPSGA